MKKDPSANKLTRRRFLETTSTAFVGGAMLGALPLESLASPLSRPRDDWPRVTSEKQTQRLLNGWDHHRGSLGGIWEVWLSVIVNN